MTSRKAEPETRPVRVLPPAPARTVALPEELLRELRRSTGADPRTHAASPADTSERALPRTVALRPVRSEHPRASSARPVASLETLVVARHVERVPSNATEHRAGARGLPLPPRTRLLLAACLAAMLIAALLALVSEGRNPTSNAATEARLPTAVGGPSAQPPSVDAGTMISAATAEPNPSPAPAPKRAAASARALAQLTSKAVDQLAGGDYRSALDSYRALAALAPEERAYALVAELLGRKLAALCGKGALDHEVACPR